MGQQNLNDSELEFDSKLKDKVNDSHQNRQGQVIGPDLLSQQKFSLTDVAAKREQKYLHLDKGKNVLVSIRGYVEAFVVHIEDGQPVGLEDSFYKC